LANLSVENTEPGRNRKLVIVKSTNPKYQRVPCRRMDKLIIIDEGCQEK